MPTRTSTVAAADMAADTEIEAVGCARRFEIYSLPAPAGWLPPIGLLTRKLKPSFVPADSRLSSSRLPPELCCRPCCEIRGKAGKGLYVFGEWRLVTGERRRMAEKGGGDSRTK